MIIIIRSIKFDCVNAASASGYKFLAIKEVFLFKKNTYNFFDILRLHVSINFFNKILREGFDIFIYLVKIWTISCQR